MPQPKKYKSGAERTAAYRARVGKAKPVPVPYTALKPGYRRWEVMTAQVRDMLQTVIDERSEYFDDRSEKWQESDKAQEFTENTDTLQEALELLEGLE